MEQKRYESDMTPKEKKGTGTKKTETDDSRAETGIYLGLL